VTFAEATARERIATLKGHSLRFFIPMRPVPKARPRLGKHGAWTPKRTRDFEEKVGWLAKMARNQAGWEVLTGPVYLDLTFVCPPAGADLSNMVKAIEDACNGILYEDDVQIRASAQWIVQRGKPGIIVEVMPLKVTERA